MLNSDFTFGATSVMNAFVVVWMSLFCPFARILRSVFVKQIPGRLVRLRFTGSSIPAMLVTVGGFMGNEHWFAS